MQQQPAVGVSEPHPARGFLRLAAYARRADIDISLVFADAEVGVWLLRHDDEALALARDGGLGGLLHADYVVADYLQAHGACRSSVGVDGNVAAFSDVRGGICRGGEGEA